MYQTAEDITSTYSIYKRTEKHFRHTKQPLADPSLITFAPEQLLQHQIKHFQLPNPATGRTLDVFQFAEPQGLYVIKAIIPQATQVDVALQSLNDFPSRLKRSPPSHQSIHL
jgi:hypothetical protein